MGGAAHTVTGIARGRQHVGCGAGEVGHALHGDGERAAPAVVETHIRKMWEYLRHRFTHGGADIARKAVAIAFAATEEQALVGAEAKVIHYELAVGHGDVAG